MFIKSKIFLLLLSLVLFIGCTSKTDKQIQEMLNKCHEPEMRDAVNDYKAYYENGNSFFLRETDDYIYMRKEFSKTINGIKNLHDQYHNTEIIPRNSEEWNLWMYYKKNENPKKSDFLTSCPYCLAEEEGKEDFNSWRNTYLFDYKIDQRLQDLLTLMENDEMKELLHELEEYLKTEECFSVKENKNWNFYCSYNGSNYYVNNTKKFKEINDAILSLHRNKHVFDLYKTVGKHFFYYYGDAIEQGINSNEFNNYINTNKIACCPLCYVRYQKMQDGSITEENQNFNCYETDYYYWKQDGFAYKIRDNYIEKKEEEKRIDEMPLQTLMKIKSYVDSNVITAKEMFDGKELKIRAQIFSVEKDRIILFGGPGIKLPVSELRELKSGQYITFLATMKFYDEYDDSYMDDDDWTPGDDYTFEDFRIIEIDNKTPAIWIS